ncbi:MAG TPA: RCC1 domain-containing protein [Nocardioides sp.]|nr:RCC1 domain-containing protein [Nocardioides sp.]
MVVAVSGAGALTGVRQISAAENHTCVALLNGRARCWGDGDTGGLGNGSGDNSGIPVKVLT